MTVAARRRVRYPACACDSRWTVEWLDGRGEYPVTPYVAALASSLGYRVRLGNPEARWARVPRRTVPEGGTVTHVCRACGFPTRVESL